MWKTMEGELSLDGLRIGRDGGGSTWLFSMTDPDVMRQLESVPSGTRVRLYYRKMVWVYPWVSNTTYHVTKFEVPK
jgi:hypothetical protein